MHNTTTLKLNLLMWKSKIKSAIKYRCVSFILEIKYGVFRRSFLGNLVYYSLKIGRFRWIVELDGQGEKIAPGFKIFGIPVFYYKYDDCALVAQNPEFPPYRIAEKRELYNGGFKGG